MARRDARFARKSQVAAAGGSSLTYTQDDTDHAEGLYSTYVAFETDSLGIVVNGVNTDVQPRINFLDGDGGAQVGNIQATSTGFVVDNSRTSGHLLLRAKDAALAVVNLLVGDPDGSVELYYDASKALETHGNGIDVGFIGAAPFIGFHDTGGRVGFVQAAPGNNYLRIKNEVASDTIELQGTDAVSAAQVMAVLDPDGSVDLHYNGTEAFATESQGAGVYDTTAGNDPALRFYNSYATGTRLAQIQLFNDDWYLDNNVVNGLVQFRSTKTATADNNWMTHTPGAGVEIRYANDDMFEVNEQHLKLNAQSAVSTNPYIDFHVDAVRNGFVQIGSSTDQWRIFSAIHGQNFKIIGEDAGGTATDLLDLDPDTIPVYTPTNVVTDRSYDANSTTVAELADVLGTLIADLQANALLA